MQHTTRKIYLRGGKSIEMELPKSELTKSQTKKMSKIISNSKIYPELNGSTLIARIRYDDDCGNGHNSFAITGVAGIGRKQVCGCIHDLISEQIPSLIPFLKWHLCSSDGPMHYVANSMYHASDRDCWGCKKGEPRSWHTKIKFGDFPMAFGMGKTLREWLETNPDLSTLTIKEVEHSKEPQTFSNRATFVEIGELDWYGAPFDDKVKAEQYKECLQKYEYEFVKIPYMFGEGKEPELEAARNSAVWPEAELEDFTQEKLLKRLLPLMYEFKNDMELLGFTY